MGWIIQYYSDSTIHTSYQRPVNVLKTLLDKVSLEREGRKEGGKEGSRKKRKEGKKEGREEEGKERGKEGSGKHDRFMNEVKMIWWPAKRSWT